MRENDLLPASASMRVAGACLLFAVTVASGISCSARRELRILPRETVLEGDGGDLDIQWADDFAFVATTVNGVGPLRFLLDTGARVVVISPAAAADVGLDPVPLNPDSAGVDLEAAQSAAAS